MIYFFHKQQERVIIEGKERGLDVGGWERVVGEWEKVLGRVLHE